MFPPYPLLPENLHQLEATTHLYVLHLPVPPEITCVWGGAYVHHVCTHVVRVCTHVRVCTPYRSVYLSLLRSLASGMARVAIASPRRNFFICARLGGLGCGWAGTWLLLFAAVLNTVHCHT